MSYARPHKTGATPAQLQRALEQPKISPFLNRLNILCQEGTFEPGACVPLLQNMWEDLSAPDYQSTAVYAGLMERLFQRLSTSSRDERVLTLQCTEKMCQCPEGRDELMEHIAMENMLPLATVCCLVAGS
jgi:hypothetical protein